MAKQIITQLLDDLDGGEAEETVTFALDGSAYEIDLSSKNASVLREFLATYQDAGTRLGRCEHGKVAQLHPYSRTAVSNAAGTAAFAANRQENMRVREWADKNGWEISSRGRIPQTVVDAYHSKTPGPGLRQDALPILAPAAPAPTPEAAAPLAAPVAGPRKRTPANRAAPAAEFSAKASA